MTSCNPFWCFVPPLLPDEKRAFLLDTIEAMRDKINTHADLLGIMTPYLDRAQEEVVALTFDHEVRLSARVIYEYMWVLNGELGRRGESPLVRDFSVVMDKDARRMGRERAEDLVPLLRRSRS